MSQSLLLRQAKLATNAQFARQVSMSVRAAANLDPVQEIFVSKIRDYATKQKCGLRVLVSRHKIQSLFLYRSAGGKMVDANAQVEKSLNDQLAAVARAFKIQDVTQALKFPTFKFDR
jgi:hypothetical protein